MQGVGNKKHYPNKPANTDTVRLFIKLSTFLEQYNYKRLGIYLFDICILDWNFFMNLIIVFVLYFLLVAAMLRDNVPVEE